MKYCPKEHQKEIISAIKSRKRLNVWSGMGTGKTSATATAIHEMKAYPALIVAPKRVAATTWPDEYKKWDHLKDVKVVSLCNRNPPTRLKLIQQGADVFTVNYDLLPWLYEKGYTQFKTIVADESTKLKSFRLRRKKVQGKIPRKPSWCLAKITQNASRHINLTGTPTPNGVVDLWGQNWFIDQGERLGKSFSAFQGRWFNTISMGDGFARKLIPWPHSADEITDKLSDVTVSIKGLDVDEPIHNVIKFRFGGIARQMYKKMKTEWFLNINDNEMEAVNPAGKMGKCLQICSGFVYGDDGESHDLHDHKIEILKSIYEEACGMPLLVSYWWKPDLKKILKAFPSAKSLDSNPKTIKDWNAGKIPMLVAHPQSCGHGLNLQDGGNILVFYSDSWGLEPYMQMIERIGPMRQKQSGYNRPVYVHHIVAERTIEEDILKSHMEKKSLQEIVLKRARKNLAS